jgi:glycosyltransferase involved in cell wall biosynthesis
MKAMVMTTTTNDQSLRVLMVVPFYPFPIAGGLEKQAHELSRSLVAQGVSVKALAVRFLLGHPTQEVVEGVFVTRLSWSATKALRFLGAGLGLAWVMIRDRDDYDVVHIHQHSWFGLSAVLIARLIGRPSLIKLPNVGDYGLPGMSRMRLGWLRLRLFKLADGVVSMSEESGRELTAIGYPATRVFWTTNGISLRPEHVPAGERVAGEPLRVVFVGRLMAQKGIDLLLRAWQSVVACVSVPCRLEIWGDGPLAPELRRECERLGLVGTVEFKGHVSGVREALPAVDVFVLPSLNEGNSNSLLEAMAAGVAVVATRVGGTPLLVGDAADRWLCEPGDIDALAEKLIQLLEDNKLRMTLGQEMKTRAERYFDIQKIASSYAMAYERLQQGRRDELSSCRLTWPG